MVDSISPALLVPQEFVLQDLDTLLEVLRVRLEDPAYLVDGEQVAVEDVLLAHEVQDVVDCSVVQDVLQCLEYLVVSCERCDHIQVSSVTGSNHESVVLHDGCWVVLEGTRSWEVELESLEGCAHGVNCHLVDLEKFKRVHWHGSLWNLNYQLERARHVSQVSVGNSSFVDLGGQVFSNLLDSLDTWILFIVDVFVFWIIDLL